MHDMQQPGTAPAPRSTTVARWHKAAMAGLHRPAKEPQACTEVLWPKVAMAAAHLPEAKEMAHQGASVARGRKKWVIKISCMGA